MGFCEDGRGFRCDWVHCDKVFGRKADLRRHYRIHINERPYKCTVNNCHKSFIQRSALMVHSRIHTGERPHVCDNSGCHKAFSDSSSLARHRRIHTGKRPYICQESTCKRTFCRKASLTRHQHRFHPPETVSSLPSKTGGLKIQHPVQVAFFDTTNQYPPNQLAPYRHDPQPTPDFQAQSLHGTPVAVQDRGPIVRQPLLVTSLVDIQRAQHHYMRLVQLYDHGCQNFPLGFQTMI
ncbi:hypothetical protein BDQ94DRAFT_164566 [Aspergillus welwitschiae]|uniref:C2H2-type domain-containing protein n=1 Tax=Aspergillus welwitschiae TaxID=1341132 RepID=A0A3F3PI25_9EURO|nr:hypothetical protein BDQ94DRAFT_164566 [Aspergillus welwitschiae]RDH26342.1 hypothetical protein BDQ94DRAFT_164566 [Aspergillus welwitschiae]